ncbi:zinc finger CCCH domain-containing protein 6 isoform X2 [Pyrus x bretschneideri]|uniref:zinc finger CCCH domain-containing protein 6 isoform X2 n=1 Tax=Pyrus x bretschneideri TaxID=225117 RepID=UPI00202EBD5C|nr:zinc finger CCCH domain-containing protein 6 isoform X2 [Pyrus x bretschneideri]
MLFLVKLFSSEDCPVAVGVKYQHHLQAKVSYMSRSAPIEHDFPPGFERCVPVRQPKVERPLIRQIQWKCPSKFVVNDAWQVAAGEESEEVEAQKLRATRVLEAVYPRLSAIPPNPSVSADVKAERCDDRLTPSAPLIPIEEIEEESQNLPSSDMELDSDVECKPPALPQGLPTSPQQIADDKPSLGNLPSQNADVIAAAVALTAIVESTEKGSLIDTDLLIKLLSDPKMIQKLINEPGSPAKLGDAPTNSFTAPMPKTKVPSVPSSLPKTDMLTTAGGNLFPMAGTVGLGTTMNAIPLQSGSVQMSGLNRPVPSPPVPVPNQIQTQPTIGAMTYPNRAPSPAFLVREAPLPPAKNINNCKNLIMQHGAEKQGIPYPFVAQKQSGNKFNLSKDMKMARNFKPEGKKPKKPKQCKYFKGSNGCRNGVNCKFQHNMPPQWGNGNLIGGRIAKRAKPNGVNTLRM